MGKVFLYPIIIKISIIKSSSDPDNEELFPVSISSSLKVWSSSDIYTEEEENIDTDEEESIDSDLLVSLSSSLYNICQKRQIHTNTDFIFTGLVLCVITHICKDAKDHSDTDNRKQVNSVIKVSELSQKLS